MTMNKGTTMNADKAFRIRQAIKETTWLLDKELEYPVGLQKADMIELYRRHIAILTARLANNTH